MVFGARSQIPSRGTGPISSRNRSTSAIYCAKLDRLTAPNSGSGTPSAMRSSVSAARPTSLKSLKRSFSSPKMPPTSARSNWPPMLCSARPSAKSSKASETAISKSSFGCATSETRFWCKRCVAQLRKRRSIAECREFAAKLAAEDERIRERSARLMELRHVAKTCSEGIGKSLSSQRPIRAQLA